MIGGVDDGRAGRFVTAVRVQLGLRQDDVATRAGVDQKVVSLIETGQLDRVSVRRFRRVCAALGIDSSTELRWRGGQADRLIDAGHAAIVEAVVASLTDAGWETTPEFSFNVFGDRGSVDVLAWHPRSRSLLIVEVKTRLTDLQAMLVSLSRKVRVVPAEAASRSGWERVALGTVVVVAATHGNRTVLREHRATFGAALPATTTQVKSWLRVPSGPLAGVWFVPLTRGSRAAKAVAGRVRGGHAQSPRRSMPGRS